MLSAMVVALALNREIVMVEIKERRVIPKNLFDTNDYSISQVHSLLSEDIQKKADQAILDWFEVKTEKEVRKALGWLNRKGYDVLIDVGRLIYSTSEDEVNGTIVFSATKTVRFKILPLAEKT